MAAREQLTSESRHPKLTARSGVVGCRLASDSRCDRPSALAPVRSHRSSLAWVQSPLTEVAADHGGSRELYHRKA